MPATGPLGWDVGLIAFVAGIASFFSPCVAPLVPGYVGYLSGTTALGGGAVVGRARLVDQRTLRASLLFVGGFSLAFVAMGLAAASFGSLLVAYRPVLETIAGIAMLAMGAFLLNLLPRAWTEFLMREWRMSAPNGVVSGVAPFGLGLLFAAGWTPCIGPVLGSILVYAGASGSLGTGAMLMVLYSLGFAVPFLAVGLGWSVGLRTLGWMKRHGELVTRVSGAALVVVGLLYLTGQVAQISIWAQHLGPRFG
jgi:cytochrome c-type biogenesis protein